MPSGKNSVASTVERLVLWMERARILVITGAACLRTRGCRRIEVLRLYEGAGTGRRYSRACVVVRD